MPLRPLRPYRTPFRRRRLVQVSCQVRVDADEPGLRCRMAGWVSASFPLLFPRPGLEEQISDVWG